ncbi:MAG: hypothetical protein WCX10_08090 [Bacteroidales bacterium]
MNKNQLFYDFLIRSNQLFFIEAEGRAENIARFIDKYNNAYGRNINSSTSGICVLGDVDKWGVELRIYFNNATNIPVGWHVQRNNIFRNRDYIYRLDNKTLIEFLFSQGCVLGINDKI